MGIKKEWIMSRGMWVLSRGMWDDEKEKKEGKKATFYPQAHHSSERPVERVQPQAHSENRHSLSQVVVES